MPVTFRFTGPVNYRNDMGGPLPMQLSGLEYGTTATTLIVQFAGVASQTIPMSLRDAELELVATSAELQAGNKLQSYLLHNIAARYPMSIEKLLVHRDVSQQVVKAIPPRRVRWRTRLFWRAIFALMKTPLTRALFLRRYRA